MQLKRYINDDTTGTVKNMIWLMVLYAIAGGLLGITTVLLSMTGGCASARQVVHDVGPKVVELSAEECVRIATRDHRPDIAELCATADDLAPLFDLIMAQQKARLAREQDGGAPSGSVVAPTAPTPPAASSVAPSPAGSASAPACSCSSGK